ncbi:hypothetical protein G3I40_38740 [Streptomyces sp. SID14478]|uniref:hypothetical protein n=1 Tax=Streptomyces sp. SID14478 TaxID=2706073 RepID=UPI0013DFBF32|nr:hypothetical protein [Streptomyces sp. SID14478]NEB81104.1 hypothetical protein [Streptomyces sp. SID14478]
MSHPTIPDPDVADRGCLRLVLAVPFALLTLVAAYFCWTALTIRPSGSWDDDAYRGIEVSCLATVFLAGAVVLLWLLPSVRRVMSWPWTAPAAALVAVAVVRWVSVPQ